MSELKDFALEMSRVVEENKKYLQRFDQFINDMQAELTRQEAETDDEVGAQLTVAPHQNWGKKLELTIGSRLGRTTHQAVLVQEGHLKYGLTDDYDNFLSTSNGAEAMRHMITWVNKRLQRNTEELSGGQPEDKIIN